VSRTPITLRGAEKLRAELKKLKGVARPEVIRAIADARSHGDLSENAEYAAAREQQGFIEWRLSHAQVIDPAALPESDRVVFGATVDLEDQAGSHVTYQIVGDDEADIGQGLISINSPIARALVGKEAGDEVAVVAPGGTKSYDIVAVRYI
jgi:transcription elongation factor GreA